MPKRNRKLLQQVKSQPCAITGLKYDVDPCHIKSWGSGGEDEEWNLIPMQRKFHIEQHRLGWWEFSNRYPIIKRELLKKGWYFDDVFGQMKLRRDNART